MSATGTETGAGSTPGASEVLDTATAASSSGSTLSEAQPIRVCGMTPDIWHCGLCENPECAGECL